MSDESDKSATKADISLLQADISLLQADISRLATKSELTEASSRLDANIVRLDKKIDRVAAALVNTQADVREIRNSMATRDDIGRIMSAIDAFARKAENQDRAVVLHSPILTEVQVGLKDHEGRISSLESARP